MFSSDSISFKFIASHGKNSAIVNHTTSFPLKSPFKILSNSLSVIFPDSEGNSITPGSEKYKDLNKLGRTTNSIQRVTTSYWHNNLQNTKCSAYRIRK